VKERNRKVRSANEVAEDVGPIVGKLKISVVDSDEVQVYG
jgi:hypothetical protein